MYTKTTTQPSRRGAKDAHYRGVPELRPPGPLVWHGAGKVNVNVNLDPLGHPLHHTSQVIPVGAPALSLPVLNTQMYMQPFSGPQDLFGGPPQGRGLLLPH